MIRTGTMFSICAAGTGLIGSTVCSGALQSFVDNRRASSPKVPWALLEPVHRQKRLALAEEETDESRVATMPLFRRLKRRRPAHLLDRIIPVLLGLCRHWNHLWLVIILAWILPLYSW